MLSRLLEGLVLLLPPGVMLRVGMTLPPFILDQVPTHPPTHLPIYTHHRSAFEPPFPPLSSQSLTHPLPKQLEGIARCLSHPNVFSFLHVPVQAGSNRVLEAMNREYTVEEFGRVVDFLHER